MSAATLLVALLAAAFAAVLALRSHSEAEGAIQQLSKVDARLSSLESDLSTMRPRPETVPWGVGRTKRSEPAGTGAPPSGIPGADPRVYVQRVEDQPHDRVILSNRSSGSARNLSLQLTGPGGATPFLPEFADQNFPVEILRQGFPYIVLASFRGQCGPPLDARLEWQDPDGSRKVREFPLSW
jgi:hypothetical protein